MPDMEAAPAAPFFALVRFGRWDEVLAEPAPPARAGSTRAACGTTRAAWRSRAGAAAPTRAASWPSCETIRQAMPAERTLAFFFSGRNMLQLAANVLAGEIAARGRRRRDRRAAAARGGGRAGHALVHRAAAVVLPGAPGARRRAARRRGRAAEAEEVYREDLSRTRTTAGRCSGWPRACARRARARRRRQVEARFRAAWARADVTLTGLALREPPDAERPVRAARSRRRPRRPPRTSTRRTACCGARGGARGVLSRARPRSRGSRWPTSAGREACWLSVAAPRAWGRRPPRLFARAGGLARRERRHVEALAAAATGPEDRALALVREHLGEFPRDAVALAAANGIYGLIGFSGRQSRNEDMVALLDGLAPAYGRGLVVPRRPRLRAHRGPRLEGGRAADRALARGSSPATPTPRTRGPTCSTSAATTRAARRFIEGWIPAYPPEAALHCHLSWHRALFELARAHPDAALAIYESSIAPGRSRCSSFHHRGGLGLAALAERAGGLFPARAGGLARGGQARRRCVPVPRARLPRRALRGGPGRDGRFRGARALDRATAGSGRGGPGAFRPGDRGGGRRDGRVRGRTLRRGDRGARADARPARAGGGSWAQRDLFEHTLLVAYLRAGRPADARALLARRVERQPSVAVRGAR